MCFLSELGEYAERRFVERLEGRMILALKGNTQRLKYIAERDRKRAIKRTIEEMHVKFEEQLLKIYKEFEERLEVSIG